MNFKYHIYKTGNYFHILSNLTEWHFACREHYNKDWLKIIGPLTKREENALKSLNKILKKYSYGNKFLGRPLQGYSDRYALKNLKSWITEKEYQKITDILGIFRPKLKILWKKQLPELIEIKNYLKKKKYTDNSILICMENFFGKKVKLDQINIYLFASTKGGGGGANIGSGKITIDMTKEYAKDSALPLIWHETTHLLFNEKINNIVFDYIQKNIIDRELKKIRQGMDIMGLFSEAIVESLFPRGFLAIKYFDIKERKPNKNKLISSDYSELRNYLAYNLKVKVKNYIEDGREIDEEFLKSIHELYLKYLKMRSNKNTKAKK